MLIDSKSKFLITNRIVEINIRVAMIKKEKMEGFPNNFFFLQKYKISLCAIPTRLGFILADVHDLYVKPLSTLKLWPCSVGLISRLKNTVGWFVVREKYCSSWKNKLKKTDYKPDEQAHMSCTNYIILKFLTENRLVEINTRVAMT
jgi:hypothetical protein